MNESDKVLSLKYHYRSGKDDLGRDFFLPCLSQCISYKRAVGYFSSSALISWAAALPRIVNSENILIKLLVSPNLIAKDKEALQAITDSVDKDLFLQNISDQIVIDALEFAMGNQTDEKRMRLFSWMVATGRLELRFAYPNHVDDPGIFHEKIGIFEFPWGDKIAFTGSANESQMGHSKNYESVDVFRGWNLSDKDRVSTKEEEFEEAWDGIATGLTVKKLTQAVLKRIKEYTPEDSITPKIKIDDKVNKKWRHQDEAIKIFLDNERGILEMATGTGKTRTSLRICRELILKDDINTIVITMDGNDLLEQWYTNVIDELKQLPIEYRKKFTVLRHYKNYHECEYFNIGSEWKILIISRMELKNALRGIVKSKGDSTLLIHDEVHRLGSPANRRDLIKLTDTIRYRLGLSATPEREYDEDGNDFITEQIGPVLYEFDLPKAISRGILCSFDYYPLEYEITDEDRLKLRQLMGRFEASKKGSNPMTKEELWTHMAMVYKTSEAKIPIFNQFISSNIELLNRCIIFVATQVYGDKILNNVHRYNSNFHTYFSGEESGTLKRFANDELECLITCHRLSEGIDIKSLKNVILFSSDRARLELIQRIGRCLRTNPDDTNKRANVVDFIRINGSDSNHEGKQTSDEKRRDWLMELSRLRPEE